MGNSPSHTMPKEHPPADPPLKFETDEAPVDIVTTPRRDGEDFPTGPLADPNQDDYRWNKFGLVQVSTGRLCDVPAPKTREEAAGFHAQVLRLLESEDQGLVRITLTRAIGTSLNRSKTPPPVLDVHTTTTPTPTTSRIGESDFVALKKKPSLPTAARFTPSDDWSKEVCHKKIDIILAEIQEKTGKRLENLDITGMKLAFHPLLQKDRTPNRFEAYWYVLKLYKFYHELDQDGMDWYQHERLFIRAWVRNHYNRKKNDSSPPVYVESDDSWDIQYVSPTKKPRHDHS